MARTTEAAVKALLNTNYDADRAPSLLPFVDTASAMVDRVQICATAKGEPLTTVELELVERWLSCHFYEKSDPMYTSRSTAGASGSFLGQTGMHLEQTYYGQTAMDLDGSGCLTAISKRAVASGFWGGKTIPEQIPYDARNT